MHKISNSHFAAAAIFSLLLIFLQEGFSYYLSVQILALVFVVFLIVASKPSLKNTNHQIIVFLLFSVSIGVTATLTPVVVSRNSSNIIFTVAGMLVYLILIISLQNIKLKRVNLILFTFQYASAATILLLAFLMVVSELNFLPFLNRETLLLQNSTLVTNYSNPGVLENEITYLATIGQAPRIDLFYGESSYLAIVLFSCVVCYELTSRLILDYRKGSAPTNSQQFSRSKYQKLVVLLGIATMIYIQSLSSIIYALLIIYFMFKAKISMRLTRSSLLAFFIFVVFIALNYQHIYEYATHRILNFDNSISTIQRFGSLLNFGINDYLFGLKDVSRMPEEGFHNGLFYIIAITGFAGIYFLYFVLRKVYRLAKLVNMSGILVFATLALIMQNGAVLSPNKVVLFALIFLPLSCARTIYPINLNLSGVILK